MLSSSYVCCLMQLFILWDHIVWGQSFSCLSPKPWKVVFLSWNVIAIMYYFFWRVTSADHKCVKTRSQDPMLIYFTSGSTGSPKMVVQSHGSYGIGFATSGRYSLWLLPVYWLHDTITDWKWDSNSYSKCRRFVSTGSCFFLTFPFSG